MNYKIKETILLLLLIFVSVPALFLRKSLFGWDGYASASCIKFGFCNTLGWQDGALFLFQFFPDNLLFFKIIMFFSLFFTLLPIFFIVKQKFDSKNAFISIFLLLSLSPFLLFEFSKFENELFAFPLIAWGLYFLVYKNWLKSLLLFSFSFWFWFWPGYFSYNNILFPGPSLEQQPFSGIISLWFLFPFVFLFPFFKNRFLVVLFLVFFGFFLWNTKFFLFLLFFIGLIIPFGIKFLGELSKFKWFGWFSVNYVFILAFFSLVGINVALLIQQPTPIQSYIVDEAVFFSEDKNLFLYNDWDYGYWLWYSGVKVDNNPGVMNLLDFNNLNFLSNDNNFLVLTSFNDFGKNCLILREYFYSGSKKIVLWKC